MPQIKPMDENYIHTTCLHEGPVKVPVSALADEANVNHLPAHPWSDETVERLAERCPGISHGNSGWDESHEFLHEMIHRYGSCALLAWEDQSVVGQLRFYPMAVARLMAHSQMDPSPLLDCTAACDPEDDEGTLWIQCVMTSTPYRSAADALKAGARQGVGQQLVQALIAWAGEHGWKRIVKVAHCDLDWFYGIQGGGGRAFWEKAGFEVVGAFYRQAWEFSPDAWKIVQTQMNQKGMTEKDIWTWYRMAYEL